MYANKSLPPPPLQESIDTTPELKILEYTESLVTLWSSPTVN